MNTHNFTRLTLLGLLGLSIQSAHAFSDITISDKLYPATTYLEQQDVFRGYDDGTFGRDKLINRVEALKSILTAAETEYLESYPEVKKFSDVPDGIWFETFVNHSASKGIVSGDANGNTFSPNRNVNKAELLKMLMLAFEVDPTKYKLDDVVVNDVATDVWFGPYVRFAVKFNIMQLDANQNANPSKELTRGEVAEFIFNMLRQGRGLEPQTLLNLSEIHLIKSLELIDQGEISSASLLVNIAEKYTTYSLEILPNNGIVQSADKVVAALKSVVGSYAASASGNYADSVTNAQQAWKNADESFQLNENNMNLANKIKTIAEKLAADARAKQ